MEGIFKNKPESEESVDIEYGEKLSEKEKNGWLNEDQKKFLRMALLACGVAVAGAETHKRVNSKDELVSDVRKVTEIIPSNIGATPVIPDKLKSIETNIPDGFDREDFSRWDEIDGSVIGDSAFQKEVEKYREKIPDHEINAIYNYAKRPVRGAEEFTRYEYVQEAIQFTEWDEETGEGVHPVAQKELRKRIPHLCAKESGFNASLTSPSGAKGIFQIMPENWERNGGKIGREKYLKDQVEVAGKLISDTYDQVKWHLKRKGKLDDVMSHFPDVESFERDFMVPVTLNSYQTGAGRMTNGVKAYIEETADDNVPGGRDLYFAIAKYAEQSQEGNLKSYGPQSRDYVTKGAALGERLAEKFEAERMKVEQLAQKE